MSNNFEISQQIEQKLSITPKMIQRISILSSTSEELGEMIVTELDNNPALEENRSEIEEFENLPLPTDFENYQNEYTDNYREKIISKKINLYEFLERQVSELKTSTQQRTLLIELINNIGQNGYFPPDFNMAEIEKEKKISSEILEDAIKVLQSFEPSGVGARNITECLYIQIQNLENDLYPIKTINIAKNIIKNNLEKLKKKSIRSISKELQIPEEELHKSIELIKSLKVTPTEEFIEYKEELKIPDILVSIKNGVINVRLNEEKFKNDGIKPLSCNKEYIQISKNLEKLSLKEQKHIKEKLVQAKNFIENVKNWKETLLRVGTMIAKSQNEYLQYGIQNIKPLKLEDIANETGFHISTISRTINGKFLETPIKEVRDLVHHDADMYLKIMTHLYENGIWAEDDAREPWFLCEAHTAEIIAETLNKFEDAVKAAKD